MFFPNIVYVGIDPTAGTRPIEYAAMDGQKRILALDHGDMESVLAFVAGLDSAIVALAAPQGPNRGLLRKPAVRRRYNLRPDGSTWSKWRVCEYELRSRNIRLYNTPGKEEAAPRWVQNGFSLYRRLEEMGFEPFVMGQDLGASTLLEANPHACFSVLLERRPFLKGTLEGRMQRQLVLYLEGLDITNPLYVMEEITRHHLLTGNLPLDGLLEADPLDALVSAYTAFLVGEEQSHTSQIGHAEEGWVTLPVGELKDFYP
jgi:hypothetical protein